MNNIQPITTKTANFIKQIFLPPYRLREVPVILGSLVLLILMIFTVYVARNQSNVNSHADTANSAEVENGVTTGNVTIISDANASGGKYAKFGPQTSLTPSPTPGTVACTTSNATGAGSPANTVSVGAPVANQGDSSTEIQNAIDSASSAGGGKVVLQAGTYTIANSITVKSGVDLTGAGINSTTLMASDTSNVNPMVTVPSSSSNVTVENMTVNQNGASAASHQSLAFYLIETRGTNTIFQNIATRMPSTYSMVAVNANTFCFRNNNVLQDPSENGKYNQLDGIHILNSSNGDVLDNYVDNAYNGATDGDDGMVAHIINGTVSNVRYEGNIVRGGATAGDFDFAMSGGTITGITLKNNEFWGGPDGVRDANFGGAGGTLSNISLINNFSHNQANTPQQSGLPKRGYTLPYDSGITQTNITVNGWYWCDDAGGAPVPASGTSNGVTVSGVTQYSTCTDAPSTSTPPAVYPPAASQPTQTPTSQPASSMIVGLDGNTASTGQYSVISGAVNYVRAGSDFNPVISGYASLGVKEDFSIAGPYNSNGVIGLGDPTAWANNALSLYKSAGCDPTECPLLEVLNEPAGSWYWGPNAASTQNAAAYAALLKATYSVFNTAYGANHPKILASFDGGQNHSTTWGQNVWAADPTVANYVDGVVVHPYGTNWAGTTASALGARQNVTDAAQESGKPVYVTEVGWSTAVGQPSISSSYQWTEAQQCNNIYNFITWARSTQYVSAVFIYNWIDIGTNNWFGVTRQDGSQKPSYNGLKAAAQNLPNPCPAS